MAFVTDESLSGGTVADEFGADARTSSHSLSDLSAWLALLGCALANLALYALLLDVAPGLISAQHSFAEQIIPLAERYLRGSCLDVCGSLVPAGVVAVHSAAAPRFLGIMLALFLVYAIALKVVANRRSVWLGAAIMGTGAACLLLMLVSPALLSGDMFSYIIYGRIASVHGGNPYAEIPASYSDDPYLQYVFWRQDPTYYGPVWTLVSSSLVLIGGENAGLTVLLFRVLSIAAVLGSAGLIWLSLVRAQADRALHALIFFLWNPMIVLELGLSAHNDALMLLFVAAAVWLHVGRKYSLATTALVVAVLAKIVIAPALGLYVVMALRQMRGCWARARFLTVSGLTGIAAVSLTLAAAGVGPEVLTVGSLGVSADRYVNSLDELAFNWLRQVSGQEPQWADVPLRFQPHWIGAHADTELWSESEPIGTVGQWDVLLATAPQSGQWIRVYEPRSGRTGYVSAGAMGPVEGPGQPLDEEAARLEVGPLWSPAAVEANTTLRIAGWAAFGLVSLLATWQARDLSRFLIWTTAVMLTYYWLAASWMWPWYVTWALVLAAFVPNARIAGLTAVLSATVLTLYASMGFEPAVDDRIYVYRALPAFALPLLLWGLWTGAEWMLGRWARRGTVERTPVSISTGDDSGMAA